MRNSHRDTSLMILIMLSGSVYGVQTSWSVLFAAADSDIAAGQRNFRTTTGLVRRTGASMAAT